MMYRKIWLWLLTGLRGKVELGTMNAWDKIRYLLIMGLPVPRRGE